MIKAFLMEASEDLEDTSLQMAQTAELPLHTALYQQGAVPGHTVRASQKPKSTQQNSTTSLLDTHIIMSCETFHLELYSKNQCIYNKKKMLI